MPATKGTNRFEAFQLLKQASREALISEFLSYLKASRVRHTYVTQLAEMVAKHITVREGKPCNRATLLRNPRYKSMLLSYMAENLAGGTKKLQVKNIYDPKTQALVMTVQVEASNQKRDNERLRLHVKYLESQIAGADKETEFPIDGVRNNFQFELEKAQIRFARVCQALQLVIRHFDSMVSVDMSARQILDLTKSRNNVIVDSEIAAGFFDWLDANSGIG